MRTTKLSRIIAIALATTTATPLYAAEDAAVNESKSVLEIINITATKRSESIQTVPVSVSALSGAQLDALGSRN